MPGPGHGAGAGDVHDPLHDPHPLPHPLPGQVRGVSCPLQEQYGQNDIVRINRMREKVCLQYTLSG